MNTKKRVTGPCGPSSPYSHEGAKGENIVHAPQSGGLLRPTWPMIMPCASYFTLYSVHGSTALGSGHVFDEGILPAQISSFLGDTEGHVCSAVEALNQSLIVTVNPVATSTESHDGSYL